MAALAELDPGFDWDGALDAYYAEHDTIGTGPDARSAAMLLFEEGSSEWRVRQILEDPAGDHDWGISAVVDLAESDDAGVAVLRLVSVARL